MSAQPVINALKEGFMNMAIEMWKYAIAFLAFLFILALLKIGIQKLISHIKNKWSRS